jgi:hypothetical protein
MEVTRETLAEWRRQIAEELQSARRHLDLIHAHAGMMPAGV